MNKLSLHHAAVRDMIPPALLCMAAPDLLGIAATIAHTEHSVQYQSRCCPALAKGTSLTAR